MSTRWVPLRTSIYAHLKEGKLTPKAFLALLRIIDLANHQTGIWCGSAVALAAECGPDYYEGGTQKILCELEKQGYIRRFRAPAQRGNYPIVVDQYCCTAGPLKDKFAVLGNAVCEEDLIYEDRGQVSAPAQAAPNHTLHPDVAVLETIFTESSRVVHQTSREALSKFLTQSKPNLDNLKDLLNFAFESEFWSTKILRFENLITACRKGTLQTQYEASLKKNKRKVAETQNPGIAAMYKPRKILGTATQ